MVQARPQKELDEMSMPQVIIKCLEIHYNPLVSKAWVTKSWATRQGNGKRAQNSCQGPCVHL